MQCQKYFVLKSHWISTAIVIGFNDNEDPSSMAILALLNFLLYFSSECIYFPSGLFNIFRQKTYLLSKFCFSYRCVWHTIESLPCGLYDKLTGLISSFFSLFCTFSSPSVIQWFFSESFPRVLVSFLTYGDQNCGQNYSRSYNFDKHKAWGFLSCSIFPCL